MSIGGTLSTNWQQISPDDVCKIIKLILDSNKSFKIPPKKPSAKLEDHITDKFCAHLRNNKNRSKHFFLILPQVKVLDNEGTEIGRIDLKFILGNEENIYFSFESKVLRLPHPSGKIRRVGYGKYVTNGMYRYFNGQYASGLDKGGMLGYVMDENCAEAIKGLKKAIEKRHNELYMQKDDTLKTSSFTKSKQVKETIHKYGPDKMFCMQHIFLPMNAAPNNNLSGT